MKRRVLVYLVLIMSIFIGISTIASANPVINANTIYYDTDSGLYLLKGNVYIGVGDRIITAGQAKVSMSSLEVWAYDSITFTQGDISLKANSVHVYGGQKRALISGGVTFTRGDLTIAADNADFNWSTKLSVFTGNVQVKQGANIWSTDSVTYNVETNSLQ